MSGFTSKVRSVVHTILGANPAQLPHRKLIPFVEPTTKWSKSFSKQARYLQSTSAVITSPSPITSNAVLLGLAACFTDLPKMLNSSIFPTTDTESMVASFAAFPADPPASLTAECDRMMRRLTKLGLEEKKVKGDGACQFRALAAALWDDENRHSDVRSTVVDWLNKNEKTAVDANGTPVSAFLDTSHYASWSNYIAYQSGQFNWGDQLTLFGASNAYNLEIRVISSVAAAEDEHAISTILPLGNHRPEKGITLSLWHETHYNLCVPIASAAAAPAKVTSLPPLSRL